MAKQADFLFELGQIETLARQQTRIHALDPRAKLLTALLFIVAVMSFPSGSLSGVVPFLLYPVIMAGAADIPTGFLLKRLGLALPFLLFIGLFNPIFDREIVIRIGAIPISGGWVSFCSIMLRGILTIAAAIILVATTGWYGVCMAFERIGVPRLFVMQLLFVYRYLFVLLEEAAQMARARTLRSFSGKGLGINVWGTLIGHLLLRAIARAERIHLAMFSRGFDGGIRLARQNALQFKDLLFLFGWSALFLVFRRYNLSLFFGNLLTDVITLAR